MRTFLISALLLLGANVWAEEKTCAVSGMHCTGCTEMVQGSVCNEKYSTCDVKVTDEKKQMGTVHLITKDAAAKIDEKALGKIIDDSGYKLESCKATKTSAPAKKS